MTYLPDNCDERPPAYEPRAPASAGEHLNTLVPEDPNKPFDLHALIDGVVDAGSFFELSADYASELLTAFARIEGQVVGIVGNNSLHRAGAIFPESADKAAEFILKCDAYNIPLVYLCDTPGFMVGQDVEKRGVLKRGKKFIYATSTATVPKFCVVVRKAYGAGIYAMCGPAFEPEATLALPTGEIAVMGAEAAVNAVFRNHIDAIKDAKEREAFIEKKRTEYRRDVDIHVSANDMIVDHILPASQLRGELGVRLTAIRDKEFPLPRRPHGTVI
jgi:acetyl-CoA carboxylase carboxyltransferase component